MEEIYDGMDVKEAGESGIMFMFAEGGLEEREGLLSVFRVEACGFGFFCG